MNIAQMVRFQGCSEDCEHLPLAASIYGIKQVAHRAGVSTDEFRAWRIESHDRDYLDVWIKPGTTSRIRFRRAAPRHWEDLLSGNFHTSTASWLNSREPSQPLIPDFKVPFSSDERKHIGPLFTQVGRDCVECPVDLPLSTVLTLSRFEETLPVKRDQHGRFPAFESVAWRDGFLHRPIVDEYGMALAEALLYLLPGLKLAERKLRVKIGHDVDDIGVPFSLRSTAGHTLRRRQPARTIRDLLAGVTGIETSSQWLLRRLVGLSLEHGLDTAVYWKASAPGPHDTGYDPRHPKILSLISNLRSAGAEMGIHPGYQTFESPARLRSEVSTLQEVLGENRLGGRQDHLRWRPETWVQWERLGLAYDASVGFADQVGFRASTAYPYRPWILAEQREAEILEIPLIAMDSTLMKYMKLTPVEALARLRDCVSRCRTTGGVFSLLWHNTNLANRRYASVYRELLGELAGSERYDWRAHDDEVC